MSNEEVLLKMVINRLRLLLEGSETLKSQWGAEITEIILLGDGVEVSDGFQHQAPDGRWIFNLLDIEAHFLYDIVRGESYAEDWDQELVSRLTTKLGQIFADAQNVGYDPDSGFTRLDDGDDDPIEDEPEPVPGVRFGTPERGIAPYSTVIDFAGFLEAPEHLIVRNPFNPLVPDHGIDLGVPLETPIITYAEAQERAQEALDE
jgi:hypothetical protein